jgi:hypothetical protein
MVSSYLLCPQVAAPAAAAAPPAGVPPEWAATRKQYGVEQGQLGVRTAEFHGLSPFAVFVHPSPALKLQQLWDDGNELVRGVSLPGVMDFVCLIQLWYVLSICVRFRVFVLFECTKATARCKQYGVEQGQLGVRTAEFHGLSPFAAFVHPSPALKLQQLWDDGNELVRGVLYLVTWASSFVLIKLLYILCIYMYVSGLGVQFGCDIQKWAASLSLSMGAQVK